MIRRSLAALSTAIALAAAPPLGLAEEPAAAAVGSAQSGEAPAAVEPARQGATALPEAATRPAAPAAKPGAWPALESALAALPPGMTDEERNERAALLAFYEARGYMPLWVTLDGDISAKARAAVAEITRAGEWGLEAASFELPALPDRAALSPEAASAAEVLLSRTVLLYGRYARGGRIINPAEQLNTYLDRRPQLLKPAAILDGVAAADVPDAYLRGLHPQHPQFEKLRRRYATLLGGQDPDRPARTKGGRKGSHPSSKGGEAKRLLANMEQWRWMPADLGPVYVWNNIPEFRQRVVKDGEIIRNERIVAGETGKQTPIFSRPIRRVTFKPTWKVPDSIKARELWPSLLKGGGLMREWALEMQTKDGKHVDWTRIDWSRTNILDYDVIQPNGPKSVMGKVKFSFPNQHTVFMHDTLPRDKYMFNASRRTFSHGCMRVDKPLGLAEILLREGNGWDSERTQMEADGPNNNEITLERRIPVHITYFTALFDENDELHFFPDVYGHEKRISLALDGKWDRISKGRDHLAPVEVDLSRAERTASADEFAPGGRNKRKGKGGAAPNLFESVFGKF